MENQYYRNGGTNAAAEAGHNNGADLANISNYLSGWVTTSSGTGLFNAQTKANLTVLVPSDVATLSTYDSAFWAAQRTTLIGEAVALRLEVVEGRRLLLLAIGILAGIELMKAILRGIG